MLGDIVISVETAARQAAERGHTLLDEIRILMVCSMTMFEISFCIYFIFSVTRTYDLLYDLQLY